MDTPHKENVLNLPAIAYFTVVIVGAALIIFLLSQSIAVPVSGFFHKSALFSQKAWRFYVWGGGMVIFSLPFAIVTFLAMRSGARPEQQSVEEEAAHWQLAQQTNIDGEVCRSFKSS